MLEMASNAKKTLSLFCFFGGGGGRAGGWEGGEGGGEQGYLVG